MNSTPGDVIKCTELVFPDSRVVASPGEVIVAVFLGTVPIGKRPPVVQAMNALGWFQSEVWHAQVEIESAPLNGPVIKSTIFRADSAREASESAVRFARRMVMLEEGGSSMRALTVSVMTIGEVAEDGNPRHVQGKTLLSWDHEDGTPLDAVVAGLGL